MEKEDLNLKLIEIVKKHECLYNIRTPQYKQLAYKERVWTKIGREIGKSGLEAKKKWKYLRDNLKRYEKLAISDNAIRKPYKYAEALSFLYECPTSRYSLLITPASADAEVSTDLSSEEDFQPPAKLAKNELVNSFDDMQDFFEASTIDENSKTEFVNIDTNTMQDESSKNIETSTLPQINIDIGDCTLSSEEQEEKDFIDRLIDEVKKNECIFNLKSADYKNFQHKKRLWHRIGKRVGLSGDAASKKWKSLKDSYRKYKIKCMADEGFVKQYKYAESLRFLDNYFSYRPFTKKEEKLHSEAEISTDLSCDYESLDILSTNQKLPESSSTTSSSVTSRLFQLLANKIDDTNLTQQEKNDIEYSVSSLVYSKLAEYNKNKGNVF